MNFATLKSSVESALGRSDVPDYIYTLTTAGVNRDCRFLDMQSSTTITTASNPATLPSDFGSILSAYVLVSGDKKLLEAQTDYGMHIYADDRVPGFYSIRDGAMYFAPDPDGTYTVYLEYIANLAAFSQDGDTNDVIARYPDLYLYQALTHAAIWAKDRESEGSYASGYKVALEMAQKDDQRRRGGAPIVPRSRRL